MQRFDVLLRYWGSWVVSCRGRGRIEKEGNLQTCGFPFLQVVREILGKTPSRHQPNHSISVQTLWLCCEPLFDQNYGGSKIVLRRLDNVVHIRKLHSDYPSTQSCRRRNALVLKT